MDEAAEVIATADRHGRRRRRWTYVVVGVLGVVAVGAAGVALWAYLGLALFHAGPRSPVPAFPSLEENPDPSLRGTVAYFDNGTRCVRVVAAAGTPSKDVHCLAPEDGSVMAARGKPAGPQLVWRPDGRLEVTLFRWTPTGDTKGPPPVTADWQKVVDVTTGAVEDVPENQLPRSPLTPSPPTVNERGQRVRTAFDALTGRGRITLTDADGRRTLLSLRGPGEYTYDVGPAFWAPGGDWIAATDTGDGGRILVITPSRPATTRVLVSNSGGGAGGGTAGPAVAISGEDLLQPAP